MTFEVGLVEPIGQKYPGVQVSFGSSRPGTSQYFPPKHFGHIFSSVTSVALEYVPKVGHFFKHNYLNLFLIL